MAQGEGGEKRRGRRRRRWLPAACLPRPGCFTVSAADDDGPSGSGAGAGEGEGGSSRPRPTHLIVTVNGIVGSWNDSDLSEPCSNITEILGEHIDTLAGGITTSASACWCKSASRVFTTRRRDSVAARDPISGGRSRTESGGGDPPLTVCPPHKQTEAKPQPIPPGRFALPRHASRATTPRQHPPRAARSRHSADSTTKFRAATEIHSPTVRSPHPQLLPRAKPKIQAGMAQGEGGGEKRRGRGRRWLRAACLPRPGCFTVSAADDGPSGSGSGAGADAGEGKGGSSRPRPTHLIVTVNGIVGSADDWGYAVKHFIEKHPEDVVVHCSGCNSATRTFDGIDVMGRRLAEEVISVVECRPELKKISFVAHSLGGLIARYAIALLYENETAAQTDYHEEYEKDVNHARSNQPTGRGKIAGLEPMNFITFVTPHLGTRSHKQIPLLHGSYKLEKMAFRMSWIAGRSGKHLFLKDIEDEKPPLLLQMVTDYGDLHFISALRSFKRRVVYSNVYGDFIVGWRTSSIRRQHELPKKQDFVDDGKYPHVVYVEKPQAQDVDFSDAMIYQAKTTSEMEEVMLKSLNRIPWERVDVSFKKSRQRILAHSTIQVKTYFLNSDGADVIFHMIDHFMY